MSETLSACDCRWPEDDLAPEQPCGCGHEAVRLYRDTVWHWHGQHWRSACLITALEAQVADLTAQVEQEKAQASRQFHVQAAAVEGIIAEVRARCAAQTKEIARLREALRTYGQHTEECDSRLCAKCNHADWLHGDLDHDPIPKPCTCGFGATLDEQKEQEKIDARVDGSR